MSDPGSSPARTCYVFGPYRLDTGNRRLFRNGEPVAITARVFDTLLALVERHGHAVDKETLLTRAWGDVIVEEANLARAVSTLRKALGESPDDHRYIVTLPGRGYQFVAPVTVVDAPSAAVENPPAIVPARMWRRVAVAVGATAAGLAVAAYFVAATADSPAQLRIAVLPFENLGPSEDQFVAAGLTGEITTRLAALRALRVVSYTSASALAQPGKRAQQLGAELGTDYLLAGAVLSERPAQQSSRVRITAQLVRVADGSQIWSGTFDRDLADLFMMQSEVALRVVRELRSTMFPAERQVLESVPTRNPDAYQAYLQGHFYGRRPDLSDENMARAIQHFEQAVQLDPAFVDAQAALASAHTLYFQFGYDTSQERRDLARRALERAERDGPTQPATLRARARYWLAIGGDPERALAAADEVRRQWPNRPEAIAVGGHALHRLGRWADAAERLKQARDLDPGAASAHSDLALVLIGLQSFPEAQHAIDRSIAIEPDQVLAYVERIWNTWLWKGDIAAARTLIDGLPPVDDWRFVEIRFLQGLYEGDFAAAQRTLAPWSGRWMRTFILARPVVLLLAQAQQLAGDAAAARRSFEEARQVLEAEVQSTPDDGRLRASLALAYAGLGRAADALRESRRALALMPYPEAFDATTVREDAALAATMVGAHDAALTEIATLLSTPAHFSVQSLRLDPRWRPLQAAARYRDLVADTAR